MSDRIDNDFEDNKKDLSGLVHSDKDSIGSKLDSRRRFLKGVVATSPVILTVVNRPVWARNCTLSGQLSGNLSDQDGEDCGGEGCSPGFWRNHQYLFHPAYPPEMLFYAVFGRDAFPGKSLGEVVNQQVSYSDMNLPANCSYDHDDDDDDDDDDHHGRKKGNNCYNLLRELGFHSVAALQNAATAVSFDLDVATVIESFQASYDLGTKTALENTKNSFDYLNNQICNLP